MLAKGVSRKFIFNGNPKQVVSPSMKYQGHASPIFEDSQEQYATNQLSQSNYSELYKSSKTYLSKKENVAQDFNSPHLLSS